MVSAQAYHTEFMEITQRKLRDFESKIHKCIDMLNEDQVWYKPNESSNSVANLILHLCGNARQYVVSGIGGAKDVRTRDLEFATREGLSIQDLKDLMNQTLSDVEQVLRDIDINMMLEKKDVQIFQYSPIAIVIIVTEHFSYHTGQIASITKSLLNKDLGFYTGLALK